MSRQFINKIKFYNFVIRVEGLFRGLRNIFVMRRGGETMQDIKIKNYPASLLFRPTNSDIHLLESIIYREEYNIDLRGLKPKSILDVGANIGFTSVYFANKYKQASVFAYEPEKTNFKMLKSNTNSYDNVQSFEEAIWYEDKTLKAASSSYDSWSFSLKDDEEGSGEEDAVSYNGVSMNQVMKRAGGTIDLLKMDIEGAEKDLFVPELTGWLKNVKVIVIEFHDRKLKGCSEALYKSLIFNGISFTQKNSGYNTIIYNESYFSK